MAKTPYQPPEQSKFGQFIDAMFLLVLVVASLFAPVYFGLAGGGKTTIEFADKTWAGMGQNATMQAQWEKLGYTAETAHDMIASRFDYSFSRTGTHRHGARGDRLLRIRLPPLGEGIQRRHLRAFRPVTGRLQWKI